MSVKYKREARDVPGSLGALTVASEIQKNLHERVSRTARIKTNLGAGETRNV